MLRQIDEEVLLAQMDWVRRLAARLVVDPARAEDLAQETLLAAVSHPPELAGSQSSLRAWLSRVLRNFVRLGARSDLRRRAREVQAARSERCECVSDIVERASDQHLLVEAVLALDEPYRSTVLMHYFDSLSVARIAADMRSTPAAVRKRLSRGLSMLHARLERDFDENDRSLALALVSMSGGGRRWGTTLTTTWGMIAVKTKLIAGLTCAALALVLITDRSWLNTELVGATTSPEPLAPAGDLATSAVATANSQPPGLKNSEPLRIPLTAGRLLRVRTASNGEPLEGAQIASCTLKDAASLQSFVEANWSSLGIEPATAQRWLRLTQEVAIPSGRFGPVLQIEEQELLGTTDPEGLFELPQTLPPDANLVVWHADGFPLLVPSAHLALEPLDRPVDVVLLARGRLLVHLVDGDGAPVVGAHVRVDVGSGDPGPDSPRPVGDWLSWLGPTNAQGEVWVPDVPVDTRLSVAPFGEFHARSWSHRVNSNTRTGLAHLRVARIGCVRGVIEFEDGAPGRNLQVWFLGSTLPYNNPVPRVMSDERGAFLLDESSAGIGRLHIASMGGGFLPIAQLPIEMLSEGVTDVGTIVLPSISLLEGHLTSRTGLPIVRLNGMEISLGLMVFKDGRRLAFNHLRDEEGSFSFALPTGEYEIAVRLQGGFRTQELVRLQVSCPARDLRIDLDELTGRLRAQLPAGMPADVAVSVRVFFPPDPLDTARRPSDAVGFSGGPVQDGAFEIGLIPAGEYNMEVSLGPHGGKLYKAVVIESGRTTDIGIINPTSEEVSGKVFGPDGAPLENARIVLISQDLDSASRGEPLSRETLSKEDGSYRLRLVESRQWQAFAHLGEQAASALIPLDLIGDGRTRLDFHLQPPCFIRGRVTRSGEPVSGEEVSWSFATMSDLRFRLAESHRCLTDAEGHYVLGPMLARSCFVHAAPKVRAGQLDLSPGEEVVLDFEIAPGLSRLHLEFPEGFQPGLGDVTTTCIDPRSPHFRTRRRGAISGENQVDVGLFQTRNLVSVRLAEQATIHTVVDGTALKDGGTVSLPTGLLELQLTADQRHAEPPSLILIEVPQWGVGEAILDPQWSTLPAVQDGSTMRYIGIPSGARLRLLWRDESGQLVDRKLTYEGPGPLRVSWP